MSIVVKGQIYLITNTAKTVYNQYTGQTRTHYKCGEGLTPFGYQKRFETHIREAIGEYRHHHAKLYMAMRKYGPEVFKVELLEECDMKDLDERERYYITKYDTFKNGYNMTAGGQDTFVMSEELRLARMNKYQPKPENIKPARPAFMGPMNVTQEIEESLLTQHELDALVKYEQYNVVDVKLAKVADSDDLCRISFTVRYIDNDGNRQYDTVNIGGSKKTFETSVAKGIELAMYLVSPNNIIIQERLYGYVDMVQYQPDDAAQQNADGQIASNLKKRLARFTGKTVSMIELRKYTSSGRNVIAAYIHTVIVEKLDFGGKHVTIEEALARAIEFSRIICPIDKIIVPKDLAHLVQGCQIAGN